MSLLAVVLALLAAAAYGAADFLGGVGSRFTAATRVLVVSQATGLLVVGCAALFLLSGTPTASDLALGAAAGIGGAVGLVSLYRGLARGPMSIVAPLSAGVAAIVPVGVGLLRGERPGLVVGIGVVLVIGAVALLGTRDSPEKTALPGGLAPSIGLALAAGLGFGAFASILKFTGEDAGLWPLVAARVTTLCLFAVIVLLTLLRSRPTRVATSRWWPIAIGAGILDITGNIAYLLGVREGLLSIVGPLSNLYPATTLLLAALVFGERVDRIQAVGFASAVAGAVLVSVG